MITLTEKGLYCEVGDFYIDPRRAVERAVVTHAHSDHARRGSKHYFCAAPGKGLLARRVGLNARIDEIPYRKELRFGKVRVSFHPAGHILGSAQVRVEHEGEVWVVSGDYKREPDPTCETFETVKCDTFVTEATFGNPKYEWTTTCADVALEILDWWEQNRKRDRNCVVFAYALGKAQRILAELGRHTDRPVYVFGEAAELTECYRAAGVNMAPTITLETIAPNKKLKGELVVAPHALSRSPWMDRLIMPETAFASGWMSTGAFGMHSRYDRGFVISDHADWPALIQTISETGARRVLVLHGSEGASLIRHLRKRGVDAEAMAQNLKPKPYAPVQEELF